ncbi:MAG: HAMP domain-containing histidine kinase, partial [Proteobacteria bacterium]
MVPAMCLRASKTKHPVRRLYLQIYLAFVGIVILFGILLASVVWYVRSYTPDDQRAFGGAAKLVSEILPTRDRPTSELQREIERFSEQFGVDLAVTDPNGKLLAAAGEPLPVPDLTGSESGWMRAPGPTVELRLPDGRWLTARHRHRHPGRWLFVVALLAIAIAIGVYPLARRITGRLERLQTQVDQLGAGDLTARVEVLGKDEVANLARSFNRAADRIENLVEAKRMMLASASHELRTPLTRIRMAVELLDDSDRPELRQKIAEDIADLDELIDDLLLASRLEKTETPDRNESVDLLALVAEEGARVDANVSGTPISITGDARMLRVWFETYSKIPAIMVKAHRSKQPLNLQAFLAQPSSLPMAARVSQRQNAKIFEPFYRARATTGSNDVGVGLGLSLVRQIAERHGGSARCLARDRQGAC